MTKYEFETELKKKISRLPADEIKRVIEYYGELFEDMAERGKSERDIIAEFGNPSDVAEKILSEYDGESNDAAPAPDTVRAEETQNAALSEPALETNVEKQPKSISVQKSKNKLDISRVALFAVINVLTGGVFFIVIGVGWIVLGTLAVCGGAFVLGGVVAALGSFAMMFTGHAGVGIAQLGVSVALAGIGILTLIGSVMLIKLYFNFNKFIVGGIKKLLTVKEC